MSSDSDRAMLLAEIARFEAACPFQASEKERLKLRPVVTYFLEKGGVGAEIGVFRGHFAQILARDTQPEKFYLIDPWTKLGETFNWDLEYTGFDALKTKDARDEAIARVRSVSDTDIVVIEDYFPRCSDQIKDKLDWVYLDASHEFEPTLNELRHIARMVKPGGIIAGDDWHFNPKHPSFGVFKAVQQFVRESNWCVIFCGRGNQWVLMEHPD